MEKYQTAIAVFPDHICTEKAVKTLTATGFNMKNLSVIGKGYHSEEKVVGFYNIGDRIRFWGSRGAFWGGFWGLFFGGLFLATPVSGPVLVVGYLAAVIIAGLENAAIVGALGALGAALRSIGIPKESAFQYETDIKADSFLVMARGSAEEVERAQAILGASKPIRIEVHPGVAPVAAAPVHIRAIA